MRRKAWRWRPTAEGLRFWRELRAEAMERDGGRCRVCGGVATEVDHILPLGFGRSRYKPGERNVLSNLQAICRDCHRAKTEGR